LRDVLRDTFADVSAAGSVRGFGVLTVAKIPAAVAAGYAEYLQAKTQATGLGDYYLKDGDRVETPGRWIGAATIVGTDPSARVEGEQLEALMDVRRPDTGEPLRPAGGNGTAVAAIDATFSAPKSVSAVWALGDPELRSAVERAHELAVDRATRYAVAQVAMIRERVSAGTVIHTQAADVVATGWRHSTARAVADPSSMPRLTAATPARSRWKPRPGCRSPTHSVSWRS
jgi:conjugative relaxase-like TrwC/TraI family protein